MLVAPVAFFLGYPNGKKVWLVFNLDSQKYFVSRDIIFDEQKFPYALDLLGQSSKHNLFNFLSLRLVSKS